MDIHIRSVDIQMTDELREYAERRAGKLQRFIDRGSEGQLELRRRPQRTGADVTAVQVTIRSGKQLLRSEETDFDPKRAIDQAIDKMMNQMRRVHDRRTDRQAAKPGDMNGAGPAPGAALDGIESALDDAEDDADEPTSAIVRSKRFTMKPMVADEAVEQMELLGHSFFLFFNVEEEQLNVVYTRHDGTYGLIGPDNG